MGTALQLEQLSMRYTGMLGANTPSFPDARPRSDRFRCGGRERKCLAFTLPSFPYARPFVRGS